MVSPQSAILADPDTGSTSFGFILPVHVNRLKFFELPELDVPIKDEELQLEIIKGNTWVKHNVR